MIYMMIKEIKARGKSKLPNKRPSYGYTIKAGLSVNPFGRAKALGASLAWCNYVNDEQDIANELELFWCASQYLKLAYSLFDFKEIDWLSGKKEMFGKFETREEAQKYVDIIAKRYLTEFP